MKISLGSWAFAFGPYANDPIPFDRSVKRLAEAGYDGVEICGFPPHVTLDRYPPGTRHEVVNLLRDNGLEVSGYAADFGGINPTIEGSAGKYLDLFRRNVEMCVDIGSPAIRVDTVAAPGSIPEPDYQAAFARTADVWRQAAGIAEEAGIRLVWEFEPGFAFNKPSEVVAMHDTVGHRNFKVMFDTSHAYMCGGGGSAAARREREASRRRGRVPQAARRPDRPHSPDRFRRDTARG